jgi:Xaa-Pro aminopeptidase
VAGPRPVEDGDVLRVGGRVVYEGYHALIARTGVVGDMPAATLGHYRRLQSAHRGLLASMVPGAVSGAIYARAQESRTRLGLELTTAHVGHGIGLEFQEPPILRSGGTDELQADELMLAVSVVPDPDVGYLYIEEMVTVRPDGARPISTVMAQTPLSIMSN